MRNRTPLSGLQDRHITIYVLGALVDMERIELPSGRYERLALPLSYTSIKYTRVTIHQIKDKATTMAIIEPVGCVSFKALYINTPAAIA